MPNVTSSIFGKTLITSPILLNESIKKLTKSLAPSIATANPVKILVVRNLANLDNGGKTNDVIDWPILLKFCLIYQINH